MAQEMIGTQIVTERLVALLESGAEKVLLIDSRPFVEYNTSHILEAININCSKLMKRRLQQDKVLITELIQHSAKQKASARTGFPCGTTGVGSDLRKLGLLFSA